MPSYSEINHLQAVLSAADHLGGEVAGVSVVSSFSHASDMLQQLALRGSPRLLHLLKVNAEPDLTKKIVDFISNNVVRLQNLWSMSWS